MTYATADLMDEYGDELGSCELQLTQYGGRHAFHGPVRTVRCSEDNALVKATLSTPGDGGVLVVDGGGSLRCALVGDVLAGLGLEHGWSGLVLNAAVRDVAALRELPFGVKALGSNPRKSGKDGTGEVDVEVSFGGATFTPGAWLAADDDGVIVRAGPPT